MAGWDSRPDRTHLNCGGIRSRPTCRLPVAGCRFRFRFPGCRLPVAGSRFCPHVLDDLRRDHHRWGPRGPLPRPPASPGAPGHHDPGGREEEAPGAGSRPQGRRVERRDRGALLLQGARHRGAPGRAAALQARPALLLHRGRQPRRDVAHRARAEGVPEGAVVPVGPRAPRELPARGEPQGRRGRPRRLQGDGDRVRRPAPPRRDRRSTARSTPSRAAGSWTAPDARG